jgi:hypothetical protein
MDKDWMSPPADLVREKVPSYDDSCGLCLYGIEPEISQAVHTHSVRSKTLRPEVSKYDMHKNAKALYTSIQPRWQTRIIRLWPGTSVDPLVCELFVADLVMFYGVNISALSDIVPFDALSYA